MNMPLRLPPFAFAKRHGVLLAEPPTDAPEDAPPILYVRSATPLDAISEMRRFAGQRVKIETLADDDFDKNLARAYEGQAGQTALAEDLSEERIAAEDLNAALADAQDLLESDDDAPVIRFINGLLIEAIRENASDIHVETFENRLAVRFRVDGVLRQVIEAQKALAPKIVSRIKIMARLDIAEKRLPQDGRISRAFGGRKVDVRVSTTPTGVGNERVVMRILDKQAGRLDLDVMGMPPEQIESLKRIIGRPHGILLVTGPTGSGKSTTLYGALSTLNDKTRNILTVEDPIEYYIDGVGQTQVNSKVDMTFARGLRAILRQDPDVVMIGEIRDLETALIAVQASQTGHLVLSTLHTNTAVGSHRASARHGFGTLPAVQFAGGPDGPAPDPPALRALQATPRGHPRRAPPAGLRRRPGGDRT